MAPSRRLLIGDQDRREPERHGDKRPIADRTHDSHSLNLCLCVRPAQRVQPLSYPLGPARVVDAGRVQTIVGQQLGSLRRLSSQIGNVDETDLAGLALTLTQRIVGIDLLGIWAESRPCAAANGVTPQSGMDTTTTRRVSPPA